MNGAFANCECGETRSWNSKAVLAVAICFRNAMLIWPPIVCTLLKTTGVAGA